MEWNESEATFLSPWQQGGLATLFLIRVAEANQKRATWRSGCTRQMRANPDQSF